MNQSAKDKEKAPKRSKRKPAMEPLGWDEIVSQPGMGGYLSFLNGPVPLPHLQGSATAIAPDPGAVSAPEKPASPASPSPAVPVPRREQGSASAIVPDPGAVSIPGQTPRFGATAEPRSTSEQGSAAAIASGPGIVSIPAKLPDPGPASTAEIVSISAAATCPESDTTPGVDPSLVDTVLSVPGVDLSLEIPADESTPAIRTTTVVVSPLTPRERRLRVRRCAATHDGHSLGEEVLYQALWKSATPESADSRTITIGWRGMSQLCRMTPKNCKINTQRLIRKLALQVLSPYNTPESIGTTYRVYSDSAILERRREAGLEWVVRSRGVEFVNPTTGQSILPICAVTH